MINAFERLRQTIDKVNIIYEHPEDNPSVLQKDTYQQSLQTVSNQPTLSASNEQFIKLRVLCENQQIIHLKQINSLSTKIEELTKALKRAQSTIGSYMNDIVSLQKQNDLLKQNLNQQYSNILQTDDRQRKYKQEIHRINITVNELATQIYSERNSKKLLLKQLDSSKSEVVRANSYIQQLKKQFEFQKQKIESELHERIAMYEYNVKKNSQDRQQYRINLIKLQEKQERTVNQLQSRNDKLIQDLFQSKKQVQILQLCKQNVEDSNSRISKDLQQILSKYRQLQLEFNELKRTFDETIKVNESLNKTIRSLETDLSNERKNVKLKVIEVRDKTIQMQLDMYRKQCRELIQQRAIMSTITQHDKQLDSHYQIIPNQVLQKQLQ